MPTPTQTEAGVIRVITCYALTCADGDDDCWPDGTPHFDTEAELRTRLIKDYGWTDRHGRWLCEHHTGAADCLRDGHCWSPWRPSHLAEEDAWRACGRCSTFETTPSNEED